MTQTTWNRALLTLLLRVGNETAVRVYWLREGVAINARGGEA
jgi:hypothetical protein